MNIIDIIFILVLGYSLLAGMHKGFIASGLSLLGFVLGEKATGTLEGGQTLSFMVLALSQVFHSFNMRSEHSLFKIGVFTNRNLNLASLGSILMMALVLFTPVRVAFSLVTLPANTYLVGLGLALIPVVVMELSKAMGLIKSKH